jgi:hypothetical protein
MNTTLRFLKVTAGGVALAIAFSSVGLSATSTWIGSGANNNWGNSTNWSLAIPAPADNAAFVNGPRYNVALGSNRTVNGLSFSGTGAYSLTGAQLTIGGGGVNNNITANQVTIGSALVLSEDMNLTGAAGAVLNLNGSTSGAAGKTATVQNITVNVRDNSTGTGPNFSVQSGGVLSVISAAGAGTEDNPGVSTLGAVTVDNSGLFSVAKNAAAMVGSFESKINSTVRLDSAYLNSAPNGAFVESTGPIKFGGDLVLNWAAPSLTNQAAFVTGQKWNLFQLSGTGASFAGNFSGVALAGVGGSNAFAGKSFAQNGTEWTTAASPNGAGQWLVFQSTTGNLVVVPEPSTIVFAGLGVAMSGWTMWKKRRLSKLLAAKGC